MLKRNDRQQRISKLRGRAEELEAKLEGLSQSLKFHPSNSVDLSAESSPGPLEFMPGLYMAMSERIASHSNELSVQKFQSVRLMMAFSDGWGHCVNEDTGEEGIVPLAILKSTSGFQVSDQDSNHQSLKDKKLLKKLSISGELLVKEPGIYTCLVDRLAERVNEISLEKGQQVRVLMVFSDGWGLCLDEITGEQGIAPLNILKLQLFMDNSTLQKESKVNLGYYRAVVDRIPLQANEIMLLKGNIVHVSSIFSDGWCHCMNTETLEIGDCPLNVLDWIEEQNISHVLNHGNMMDSVKLDSLEKSCSHAIDGYVESIQKPEINNMIENDEDRKIVEIRYKEIRHSYTAEETSTKFEDESENVKVQDVSHQPLVVIEDVPGSVSMNNDFSQDSEKDLKDSEISSMKSENENTKATIVETDAINGENYSLNPEIESVNEGIKPENNEVHSARQEIENIVLDSHLSDSSDSDINQIIVMDSPEGAISSNALTSTEIYHLKSEHHLFQISELHSTDSSENEKIMNVTNHAIASDIKDTSKESSQSIRVNYKELRQSYTTKIHTSTALNESSKDFQTSLPEIPQSDEFNLIDYAEGLKEDENNQMNNRIDSPLSIEEVAELPSGLSSSIEIENINKVEVTDHPQDLVDDNTFVEAMDKVKNHDSINNLREMDDSIVRSERLNFSHAFLEQTPQEIARAQYFSQWCISQVSNQKTSTFSSKVKEYKILETSINNLSSKSEESLKQSNISSRDTDSDLTSSNSPSFEIQLAEVENEDKSIFESDLVKVQESGLKVIEIKSLVFNHPTTALYSAESRTSIFNKLPKNGQELISLLRLIRMISIFLLAVQFLGFVSYSVVNTFLIVKNHISLIIPVSFTAQDIYDWLRYIFLDVFEVDRFPVLTGNTLAVVALIATIWEGVLTGFINCT